MTYQVGDQQNNVIINKKKLFIIDDYNQSNLKNIKFNKYLFKDSSILDI